MATIKGRILDTSSGSPLEGVSVKAEGEGVDKTSSTDARGDFQIDGLPSGQLFEVVAQKEGYELGIYGPELVFDEAPLKLALALSPVRG